MGFLSAVNPFLLWGGLAIASPILIHLLNKRRFQEVQWAAMEFLLEADKENRKRIRLEHLLLLFLRCLLILLATALLVRPIVDFSSLGADSLQLGQRENIILLDDSPSMNCTQNDQPLFSSAKRQVVSTIRHLAEQRPQDTVTLLRLSQPEQPYITSAPLSQADDIVKKINNLPVSDVVGKVDDAVLTLQEELEQDREQTNRALFIVSDFRSHNWQAPQNDSNKDQGPFQSLQDMAQKHTETPIQLVLIDHGIRDNLGITQITPPKRGIAAGVPTTFKVKVVNQGLRPSAETEMSFSAMGTRPLTATVDEMSPGSSVTVPFTFTFQNTGPAKIEVGITEDPLAADNTRQFAANVSDGTRVLLVDGEEELKSYNSESFYISHALNPSGPRQSGYKLDIIPDEQLGERELEQYGFIVIANLFHISSRQAQKLEQYVKTGGGVAYFLGDQVQVSSYNAVHKSHPALFPVKLSDVGGDAGMEQWRNLNPVDINHPILRIFSGDNNPLLSEFKLFRWWETEKTPESEADFHPNVLATIDIPTKPQAIVQSDLGDGKVLVFMFPADAEWTNWVTTPSYPVVMLETASYLTKRIQPSRQIESGQILREPVSASDFSLEATLDSPENESVERLQAQPDEETGTTYFVYADTDTTGFYELIRKRRDGTESPILYAANIEPDEGKLERLSDKVFEQIEDLSNVTVQKETSRDNLNLAGTRVELWRYILVLFGIVLTLEQFAGWYFGKRRSFNK